MNQTEIFEPGQTVHYQPEHYKNEGRWENGIVKSVAQNGGVFIVYNCGGNWDEYMNYTAVNTNPGDLKPGWKY